MRLKEGIALIVAILSDTVLELFGGFIPIIGDVLDVITLGVNVWAFGPNIYLLTGATEFIPLVDVLPMHTTNAVMAMARDRNKLPQVIG